MNKWLKQVPLERSLQSSWHPEWPLSSWPSLAVILFSVLSFWHFQTVVDIQFNDQLKYLKQCCTMAPNGWKQDRSRGCWRTFWALAFPTASSPTTICSGIATCNSWCSVLIFNFFKFSAITGWSQIIVGLNSNSRLREMFEFITFVDRRWKFKNAWNRDSKDQGELKAKNNREHLSHSFNPMQDAVSDHD